MFKLKIILFVFAVVIPFLLSGNYHRELLVLCCIFATLGLSMDIIYGRMGQVTLGHQSFFGIGAYTSALLTMKLGVSVWVGFLGAAALSGVFGLIVGYICLRRLRAMALAIVTFALGSILYLVARNWYDVTGGSSGLRNLPKPILFGFEFSSEISYYYLSMAVLMFVMYFLSRAWKSRAGRACVSLRENEPLARSIGVSPLFYHTLWFGIACSMAGLAGAVYAHHLTVVNPMLFGMSYMLALIIILLLGGVGTSGGPVLGAIVYIWGSELLRFNEELRLAFFGAILLIFIIFMPKGIYSFLDSVFGKLVNLSKE
jgi:branched-chain amino acid transport system permease protein